ncbi:FCD domain-containing protein [Streptomyces variegatus]|uniref:FCD domain-containing protein n=1 Tax=Streptomyces variegatus TaxID=284040 RepID=UPI003C2EA256
MSAHEREYENPRKVVSEHEPLMEAVRAGDARRAQREASHHIETNAERVQRILAAHNDG